ncbi:MAG: cell division protein FtsQ/DivIB [Thermodesulfovibrionales bacterium]
MRKVVFIGNKHISENELKTISGITSNEGSFNDMINISAKSIKTNLMKSPWITNVSIRRDFPDTLKIRVFETKPFAILEMKGKPFLIDEGGRLLEELKGGAIPFLPVILSDPFKNKDSFTEAINLAKVLRDKDIAKERNRVEIIANRDRESMSVLIDGVLIKVGYGNYDEKIERLFELEDEIRKKAQAVEYIDLRFSDNVIVKPVKEVVR